MRRTKFVWEVGFLKKSHFGLQRVFCIHIGLSVEALSANFCSGFSGREGFQVKQILFVSLGFCKLLRWPLTRCLMAVCCLRMFVSHRRALVQKDVFRVATVVCQVRVSNISVVSRPILIYTDSQE